MKLYVVGLAALCQPVSAADYKPAVCDAAKPYAGKLVRAAVALPDLAATRRIPVDSAMRARLDIAFSKLPELAKAPAITAAVGDASTVLWSDGTPDDGKAFYWASAGKTFTAVVALQLVEEGKLTLDDVVSKWIDGIPNGQSITIRHLLDHRSGLFSVNEDLRVRKARRHFSSADSKSVLVKHGAMFCPGSNWRYTNSGYGLLGAIVEAVEGRSLAAAIDARIVGPLALTSVRALAPGTNTSGIAPLSSTKEAPMNPSWAGAAGPVVGNAADMIRFWQALLGNRLLKPASVKAMFGTLYPMFDAGSWYGLGVMAIDVPQANASSHLWLGHAGGTPGAYAIVAYIPEQRLFVAVALTGDGSAAAAANYLAKAAEGK